MKEGYRAAEEGVSQENLVTERRSWIPRRIYEKLGAVALVGMALLEPGTQKAEATSGHKSTPRSTATATPDIPMETYHAVLDQVKEGRWPDIHPTFYQLDENGEPRFNYWSLLAPVQVEFQNTEERESTAAVHLPYEFSRAFDSAEPLDPEGHQRAAEFIDGELREAFADQILSLAPAGEGVRRLYESDELSVGREVTGIEVTGTASPEAGRYGSGSIVSGATEQENTELAERRGETGLDLTTERLHELGIDASPILIDSARAHITAEELQFSNAELDELASLAGVVSGDYDGILDLISEYNSGEVTDPAAIATMQRIIDTKRKVEITIRYKEQRDNVTIIPVPWLLLLLLRWPRRRRVPSKIVEAVPPPGPLPTIPDAVQQTSLPAQDNPDFIDMQRRTVVDDLRVFFDDPAARERGLDYRELPDETQARHEQFENDQQREDYLTMRLLESWQVHDQTCRQAAGEPSEEGLDYLHQPKQIQWARMHARELLHMTQDTQIKEGRNYDELLRQRAAELDRE